MSASDGTWDVVGIGANSVDYVNVLPGYPQPFGSFAKMRIAQQRVFCGGQMATAMSLTLDSHRLRYHGVGGFGGAGGGCPGHEVMAECRTARQPDGRSSADSTRPLCRCRLLRSASG